MSACFVYDIFVSNVLCFWLHR